MNPSSPASTCSHDISREVIMFSQTWTVSFLFWMLFLEFLTDFCSLNFLWDRLLFSSHFLFSFIALYWQECKSVDWVTSLLSCFMSVCLMTTWQTETEELIPMRNACLLKIKRKKWVKILCIDFTRDWLEQINSIEILVLEFFASKISRRPLGLKMNWKPNNNKKSYLSKRHVF